MAVNGIELITASPQLGALGTRLVLSRDGTATRQITTATRPPLEFAGSVTSGDFDDLAGLVESIHFFALDDRYGSLRVPYWTISVGGDGVSKSVTSEDAAPAGLRALRDAISALSRRIEWGDG
jgi:hypothetical protein